MAYIDRQTFATAPRPAEIGTNVRPIGRLTGPAILDIQIDQVHRDRDFGRVEARIGFLVKTPHRPVRRIRVSTNVPTRGDRPLRDRLVADAALLMYARRSTPEPASYAA